MSDPVNHPSHYTSGKIEVIDFIEDQALGFNLGNAVKYIARAGKKDATRVLEDLQKAAWYLEREIKRLSPCLGIPHDFQRIGDMEFCVRPGCKAYQCLGPERSIHPRIAHEQNPCPGQTGPHKLVIIAGVPQCETCSIPLVRS